MNCDRIIPMAAILMTVGILAVNAQNQIKGSVYCKDQPVPYASVTINTDSTSSSTLKGYAITNDEGSFTVKADIQEGDWLIVRSLGYKELKRQIGNTSQSFDLQLEEDAFLLNEATVKARYSGTRFSNDTISFDTQHYATGTEENIGDVLRKIPGMEVTETGKVSYAGKNIGKVLIDGKDILSSSGNLAISNLPANMMESAELLLNYKEKSITNAFKQDETSALNIKTSKSKALNGSVQLGGGYRNKYQAKSSLIRMGEKSSFSAILSANNTGDAVFSIEDYISNIGGIDNLLSRNKNTYTLANEEATMLMPPSNVYEHTNGALSLNATYVPSGKFSFKGNALYNGSFLKADSQSEDLYFSGDITNRKSEFNDDKNHYMATGFQESWKVSDRFELNAYTNFSLGRYDARQVVDNSISRLSVSSDNRKELTSIRFLQDLNSNLVIGSGILYSYIHVEATNRDNDYNILSDSLLLPVPYTSTQEGDYPYMFSNNTVNRKTSVSAETGYVFPLFGDVNLNTSLSYSHSREKLSYTEDETESDVLSINKYLAGIRLEKNKGTFRFGLGGKFSINDCRESISDKNDTKGFASPELSMQFVFSPWHRLNLQATYDTTPTEIGYLSKLYRVTGYNGLSQGSTVTNLFSNEAKVSLNYSIFDLYTNTTFFIFANYTSKRNLPMSCISQEGITNIITYRDGGEQDICMAKLYLNKGLSFLPVDARLTCSFSQTQYDVMLNNSENQIKLQNVATGLDFSSRFKAAFNAELEVSYNYQNNTTSGTSIKNDLHEWSATGKLHYSCRKVKAYIYGTFLNSENAYYNRNTVNLGFSCEYQIRKVGVKVSGRNLLHLKDMEWVGIYNTLYYTSTSLYKKVPGHLQLALSYRF